MSYVIIDPSEIDALLLLASKDETRIAKLLGDKCRACSDP
jgi:hypothetical protein